MRILFVLGALLAISGCESMDFTSVTFSSGYSHYYPANHISYTLGYYSGSYYNGYSVYGSHGHRYYYAPRHYSHHRHFARPPVVVHQHVHTTYCEHNYRPRNHYTPPVVRNTPPRSTPPRRTPPAVTPRQTQPPRATPPQVRNDRRQDRREDRQDRNDRRRDPKQKRK